MTSPLHVAFMQFVQKKTTGLCLLNLYSVTRWREVRLSTPHNRPWGRACYSLVDPVETYAVTSGSIEQWYERNCTQIPAKRSLDASKQTKFHSHFSARKVHNFSRQLWKVSTCRKHYSVYVGFISGNASLKSGGIQRGTKRHYLTYVRSFRELYAKWREILVIASVKKVTEDLGNSRFSYVVSLWR